MKKRIASLLLVTALSLRPFRPAGTGRRGHPVGNAPGLGGPGRHERRQARQFESHQSRHPG